MTFRTWSLHKWAAWQTGYDAAGRGKTLRDNPYPEIAKLHQDWIDGWIERQRDDQETKCNQSYQSDLDT